MELAEGGSLADLISKRSIQGKPFVYEEIMMIMAQITLGVMSIHSKNILHRDIKTQNIFITKEGILKIGDFGISRQLSNTEEFATTQKGTPYFMPPEVCLGKPYDSKADVWAIGIILYELITFRKPYDSEQLTLLFQMIVKDPFEPLPENVNTNL